MYKYIIKDNKGAIVYLGYNKLEAHEALEKHKMSTGTANPIETKLGVLYL